MKLRAHFLWTGLVVGLLSVTAVRAQDMAPSMVSWPTSGEESEYDLPPATYPTNQEADPKDTKDPNFEPIPAPQGEDEPVLDGASCADGCCKPCRKGGCFGGAEILWLKPYNSEGNQPIFDDLIEITNEVLAALDVPGRLNGPEWNLETAYRTWVGYESASGLGVRATYFEFDHNVDAISTFDVGVFGIDTVDVPINYAIEAKTVDVEVTQSFRPSPNWHLMVGAGYRYARYEEVNSLGIIINDDFGDSLALPSLLVTGFESESHGLTLSGQVHRRIGNFALFASSRGSILFGDEDEVFQILPGLGILDPINDILTASEEENVKFIFEAKLGGEWNYELGNGSIFFIRGTAEAQYWDNVTGIPLTHSSGSFGLVGAGLAVGLYR